MTTGYGGEYSNPTNPYDQNKWYTYGVSGTSSASPIVAATVAYIQGIAMKNFGSPLEPKEVRKLLTISGVPQEGLDTDKNIGPLVNLRNAIDKMTWDCYRGSSDLLIGSVLIWWGFETGDAVWACNNWYIAECEGACIVFDNGTNDNADEPITIEAETYVYMQGVETEGTADEGGGEDVGYIDTGDWMAYPEVNIPRAGAYTVEYRVASVGGGGILQFEEAGGTPVYGSIDIPDTGDWQNWVTISHTVNLEAGPQNFGILAASGGWNLNWFRITQAN